MKQIPLREFQLHATKYLKELPLTLTQYNKSIASVIPIGEPKVSFKSQMDVKKKEVFKDVPSPTQVFKPMNLPEPKNDRMMKTEVKTFWFGGKKYEVDEYGNEKEIGG